MIQMALELAIFGLPAWFSLFAAAGLLLAITASVLHPDTLSDKKRCLVIPLAIPLLILMYGVVFNSPVPIDSTFTRIGGSLNQVATSPSAWRTGIIYAMLFAHLPVGLILAYLVRENSAVPIGLSVFAFWLSCGAAFLSCMSVTGIWL